MAKPLKTEDVEKYIGKKFRKWTVLIDHNKNTPEKKL